MNAQAAHEERQRRRLAAKRGRLFELMESLEESGDLLRSPRSA
jgi:hypothetical protein